jgi:hypothetical protein
MYANESRLITICRLTIDNTRTVYAHERFCDLAVSELQRLTQVDFGMKRRMSRAEQDAAVCRARQWLAEHAD